jgi:hypothetical protein
MHLWLHFAVFLVDARRWNYHDLLALSFNPKRACCCSRAVAAVLFYICFGMSTAWRISTQMMKCTCSPLHSADGLPHVSCSLLGGVFGICQAVRDEWNGHSAHSWPSPSFRERCSWCTLTTSVLPRSSCYSFSSPSISDPEGFLTASWPRPYACFAESSRSGTSSRGRRCR